MFGDSINVCRPDLLHLFLLGTSWTEIQRPYILFPFRTLLWEKLKIFENWWNVFTVMGVSHHFSLHFANDTYEEIIHVSASAQYQMSCVPVIHTHGRVSEVENLSTQTPCIRNRYNLLGLQKRGGMIIKWQSLHNPSVIHLSMVSLSLLHENSWLKSFVCSSTVKASTLTVQSYVGQCSATLLLSYHWSTQHSPCLRIHGKENLYGMAIGIA